MRRVLLPLLVTIAFAALAAAWLARDDVRRTSPPIPGDPPAASGAPGEASEPLEPPARAAPDPAGAAARIPGESGATRPSRGAAPGPAPDGGASLAGLTRYPDGRIAAHVRLVAAPEGEIEAAASGRSWGSTESDGAGFFHFDDLQPGRYSIIVAEGDDRPGGAYRVFATGERRALVVVDLGRVRVAVRVVDPLGAPVVGARFSYSIGRASYAPGIESESVSSGGWITRPEGIAFLPGTDLTRAGSTVDVSAWLPPGLPSRASAVIETGTYETLVEVVLDEPDARTRLRIEVAGDDGARPARYRARLFGGSRTQVLHAFEHREGEDETLHLTPGTYHLEVVAHEPSMHYFPANVRFEARGAEQVLPIELKAAGRLVVTVHPPEGLDRLRLRDLGLFAQSLGEELEDAADLSVISYRLLDALREDCRDHATATAVPYTIPPLQLLWPGSYRLAVEFADCLPVERWVEIHAGATTELDIQLARG